ncbi:ATP-binding protein [Izhakiella australiensis]|uniref:ATP-binding protein n=1 Tax=Izhakiella australiensis TaxID=1926881 RepID=UPI0011159451|nr:ATP-binding protein [Izhakiella australiensis]
MTQRKIQQAGRAVRRLSLLWLLLPFSVCLHAEDKIGILSHSAPFSANASGRSVLADDAALLWQGETQTPELIHYASKDEALQALSQGKIHSLIAAGDFADAGLKASAPLMTFRLCLLGTQSVQQPLLVLPEIPDTLRAQFRSQSQKLLEGDSSLYDDLRRMTRNEASGVVAPCFMVNQFMLRVPISSLPHSVMPDLQPMYYRAWVPASNQPLLDDINRRISRLDKRDVRGLEQRWGLPTGSVTDQRTWMDGSIIRPLTLRIALVGEHPPLVIADEDNDISGVWRDLLNTFFPPSIFSMQITRVASKQQAEQLLRRGSVDLVMGDTAPVTEGYQGVIFDHQVQGLVSLSSDPLSGNLTSLRHKRLVIVRDSPLMPLLKQRLPAEGVLQVDNITQGLALIEAGGAEGMIADAFSLNYELQRRDNDKLILRGVDLPELPLWFVLPRGNSPLYQRLSDILEGITVADIQSSKSRWLASGDNGDNSRVSLWVELLAMITLFAVILTIAIIARHFIRQRQSEQTHRQLNDALRLWQALLNSAPVPQFICDPAGRVVRFNQAFAEASIVPPGIVAGTLLPDQTGHPLAEWLSLPTRIAALNSAEPFVDEVTVEHQSHSVTLFRWLARYTDSEGIPQGMVGGWIDISDKAALESALNRSLMLAEKASEEKSQFLARMSHDIRTPLNVLLGLLDIERETHSSLELAWQAATTLRDLVGDILDLSRIEAGELLLQPDSHNLSQILQASEAIFASSARSKGLEWHSDVQIPPSLFCRFDHVRFNQIVANLLGNAIKYTTEGSVTLQARYQHEQLSVAVIDTGIGIPPERQESIFQPWFQLDATTPYSSGLGLAICKQLITLMAGTLEIVSEPGKGTRVLVTLPLETAQPPVTENLSAENLSGKTGYHVLLVDDFPANLTVMSMQLGRLGHQVTACATPGETLEYLRHNQPDILITDSQMPEMDGYRLVEQVILRGLSGELHCPTLLLGCTANALRREEERARDAGMDALLRKPLSESRLQQALSRFPQVASDVPDLQEIQAMAGQQSEMVTLMLQQLKQALDEDLQQLDPVRPEAENLARIAHRLKASWSLLRLHRAERFCQIIEKLPDLLAAGDIQQHELTPLVTRFIAEMRRYQRLLLDGHPAS